MKLTEQEKQIFDEAFGMRESRQRMYAAVEAVLAQRLPAQSELRNAQIEQAWENYSGTPAPFPASQVACHLGCVGTCKGHTMAQNAQPEAQPTEWRCAKCGERPEVHAHAESRCAYEAKLVPEAQPVWRKCSQCKREHSVQSWEKNNGKCPNCDDIFDKEDREASEFAAMANEGGFEAQPAPDVIERMCIAYCSTKREVILRCDSEENIGMSSAMTAAAQVLLDEALGAQTADEVTVAMRDFQIGSMSQVLFNFLANRRARLAAKPQQETREQQVTAILQAVVKETNEQWEAAAEKVARVREGK